jgi:mono/diheme cytochrome c family protein
MITLLTTEIWTTGKPLRSPMPEFHMTRADAEAVLAYLKSITSSRGATQ